MRSIFIGLLVGPPSVGLVIAVIGGLMIAAFVKLTPVIQTEADLAAFKRLAARQMVLALVQIVVLVTPIVALGAGIATGHLGRGDILYLLVPSLVVLGAGLAFKRLEQRAQRLPVAEGLRLERDLIVEVWLHRPWPDW